MKIAFKDFDREKRMLGFSRGPLQAAVDAANEWISTSGVQVINIETLTDTDGMNGMTSTVQDGIRVWYVC